MKLKNIFLVGAMVALLGSQSVLANPIDVTYNGSAHLVNTVGVGYITGTIAPTPSGTSGSNVSIGGDSFTSSASGLPGSPFDAWCVDIYHWLANGTSSFNIDTTSSLANTLDQVNSAVVGSPANGGIVGTQRVSDLGRLANAYYYGLSTLDDSAAFQLAVWAITYGTYSTGYSVNMAPGFSVTSNTNLAHSISLANNWLGHLGATPTAEYSLLYLSDASAQANATQDMIVFVKTAGSTVPEPGTIALLGIGLLAASLIRRHSSVVG